MPYPIAFSRWITKHTLRRSLAPRSAIGPKFLRQQQTDAVEHVARSTSKRRGRRRASWPRSCGAPTRANWRRISPPAPHNGPPLVPPRPFAGSPAYTSPTGVDRSVRSGVAASVANLETGSPAASLRDLRVTTGLDPPTRPRAGESAATPSPRPVPTSVAHSPDEAAADWVSPASPASPTGVPRARRHGHIVPDTNPGPPAAIRKIKRTPRTTGLDCYRPRRHRGDEQAAAPTRRRRAAR